MQRHGCVGLTERPIEERGQVPLGGPHPERCVEGHLCAACRLLRGVRAHSPRCFCQVLDRQIARWPILVVQKSLPKVGAGPPIQTPSSPHPSPQMIYGHASTREH